MVEGLSPDALPFVVIEYDKKVGGYKLQEKDGKVLKNFVLIEKLKLIEEFEDDEDQEEYEILEVLDHRGPPSKQEYFVKWAGKHEDSWLPQRKFVTTDCISVVVVVVVVFFLIIIANYCFFLIIVADYCFFLDNHCRLLFFF